MTAFYLTKIRLFPGPERHDRDRRRPSLLPRLRHHRPVQGLHPLLASSLHRPDNHPQGKHRTGSLKRPANSRRHPEHPPEEHQRQLQRVLLRVSLPPNDPPLLRLPLQSQIPRRLPLPDVAPLPLQYQTASHRRAAQAPPGYTDNAGELRPEPDQSHVRPDELAGGQCHHGHD